jgi:hypothetical protein
MGVDSLDSTKRRFGWRQIPVMHKKNFFSRLTDVAAHRGSIGLVQTVAFNSSDDRNCTIVPRFPAHASRPPTVPAER